jgi:hypothetical protein
MGWACNTTNWDFFRCWTLCDAVTVIGEVGAVWNERVYQVRKGVKKMKMLWKMLPYSI